MWATICLAFSQLLVGVLAYTAGRVIWYRRGLDHAWKDFTGEVFPQ